jgi:predicted O-linked N-acetylglucosamine transferase (SPINDLY family)
MHQLNYFLNKSLEYLGLQDFYNAENYLHQVLKIQSNNIDALRLLGVCAALQKKYPEALKFFDKVIKIAPQNGVAHSNRGNVLQALGKHKEALRAYDLALSIEPNYAEAYNNRGNTLQSLGMYEAAILAYNSALSLAPNYSEAYVNQGNALQALGRYKEAIDIYSVAIVLNPSDKDAYRGRADALQDSGRYAEAIQDYDLAIQYDLNDSVSYGMRRQAKLYLCQWNDFDRELFELCDGVISGEVITPPFLVLTSIDSLELQKSSAELWVNSRYPLNSVKPQFLKSTKEKVCIGYFSSDFHNHATSLLMAEFFETHDRKKFELVAFSFGPDIQDEMRSRLVTTFDTFLHVDLKLDKEIAEISRSLGVDIAVDLKGFTKHSRPGIFANRAAPIQVSYLGYPGTMGASFIDYLIADPILVPENSRLGYCEKIAYLPDTYQANDTKRQISNIELTRDQFGLSEDSFVFCCFNSIYKITPDVFVSWMRILNQVPKGILWLLSSDEIAMGNLKKEAEMRGVDGNRIIFSEKLELSAHLARHKLADLFLDTFPCNAHTTASDSLWAGLPFLTRMGESFVSRVGASLLSAIDLRELITSSQEDYENKAIYFGNSRSELDLIREKLNGYRLKSPLFNTPLITRNIENLFTQMYERSQNSLPIDHLYVNAPPS